MQEGKALIEDQTFREKIADDGDRVFWPWNPWCCGFCQTKARARGLGRRRRSLKIRGTEVQQGITELLVEAVGNYAHPYVPDAMQSGWNEDPIGPEHAASIAPHYFNWRKASIYGGSNEIQKNIIAKAVLGF